MAHKLRTSLDETDERDTAFLNSIEAYVLVVRSRGKMADESMRIAMHDCGMRRCLQIDLQKVIWYTIQGVRVEGSGLQGRFATGGFWSLGALIEGEPDRDSMASLPGANTAGLIAEWRLAPSCFFMPERGWELGRAELR
jgi:hypothetical protein